MVKRPFLLIFLLGMASIVCAQQSWEGLATVSRFGRFPAGLYGASNLVSPNSLVSVRNLETGLSERIIITDGVDEPGVFLVLSPEAAAILNVSGSGATRVRLTTIVSEATPVDPASEQPFHPDPDINPVAGVPLDLQLPGLDIEVADEPIEVADEPIEVADEPIEVADEPIEVADEPIEVADEPIEVADEPIEVADEPIEVADEPVVTRTGQRHGIAAGVARTQVGQAQQSFERPDTALEAERPEPTTEIEPIVGEPEVEPEEVATAGIETLDRAEEGVPIVSVRPEVPRVEIPTVEDTIVEDTIVEDTTVDTRPVETVEPESVEDSPVPINPINEAVAAAVDRIPPRDFFPPPVGEEGDLGFTGLNRPSEAGRIEAVLAEAEVPPVDRPELAGLAPLQATPAILPGALAEAAVPPEDLPEFAAFSMQTPPSQSIGEALLPVALAGAEERPIVQDLPPYSARDATLTSGILAEATVEPPETPNSDAVAMATPPAEPVDATLAQAGVAESERPELADIGPAEAPTEAELVATLAEAGILAEERPDLADIGQAEAPTESEIESILAQAGVLAEERPELADIGPAGTPAVPPLDAQLVEAVVAPSESPDADAMAMVGSPVEPVDAELAEAGLTESERPELADVGPAEAPAAEGLVAVLAEASPEAEERPDDSLAAAEPAAAGEVSGVTLAPEPGEEEIVVVESSIESPGEIPEDALLTLEPADFRPPEYPSPDDESLIDRETPAEEPVFVAVLEAPDAAEPVEVVEPIEVVEETVPDAEPIEVAVVSVDRPVAGERALPVVTELVDNNYYLQIGAYTVPATAQIAVDALSATYPMAVLPIDSHGTTVYRVLVGPLEQDETGTLLLWLRAKGYRDTFIRSGTEL